MGDPARIRVVSSPRTTIRVATWNLWWRFGDLPARQRAILEELRVLDADVICLQEVWGAAGNDFAQVLAAELGYESVFEASPRSDRWQERTGERDFTFGNALLSRWPIADSRVIPLPAEGAPDEGRFALFGDIETPHGRLPVVNTHLNAGWGQSSIRTSQLTRICRELHSRRDSASLPPVLCGDFNAGEDFDEVRALAGKRDLLVPGVDLIDTWWATRPGEPGYTWDRANPLVSPAQRLSCRVDYIFVGYSSSQGLPVATNRFAMLPRGGVWASDHYGVFADLAYGDEEQDP